MRLCFSAGFVSRQFPLSVFCSVVRIPFQPDCFMKDFLLAILSSVLLLAACQSDDNFVVREPIKVSFTASDTVVVQGSEVTFTNQSTGFDSTAEYRWIFEGGIPGTSEEVIPPTVGYADTGRYLAGLLVSVPFNDSSSTIFSEIKYITVQPD